MKAFLSHSSKDKAFVEEVAKSLGTARCEYDAYTFDFVLSSQAIRKALQRSSLFVLFLSKNSVASNFVSEEIQTAQDLRASGGLKKVIVISLDDSSFHDLPGWMQSINVVCRLTSSKSCARKIEAELIALDTERDRAPDIYIPREAEEAEIRNVLRRAPGVAPVVIHAVGHEGIGRRTLLRKTLASIFPRQIQTFVPVPFDRFEGVNELYRRLHDNLVNCSVTDRLRYFDEFADAGLDLQVEKLIELINNSIHNDECILIEDNGGLFTDEGDYQPFLVKLIEELKGALRPIAVISQSRMMPFRVREQRPASYHVRIPAFSNAKIEELLSFSLRAVDIDFNDRQLHQLTELVVGYPINAKLAIKAISSNGLPVFIANPSILLEWKRRRADDFLAQIQFSKPECDIASLLVEFRVLEYEFIATNIRCSSEELAEALRKLEDFCCVERKGTVYSVAPPIQDALSRDKRFRKSARWRAEVAQQILNNISEYRNEDSVRVSVLEAGAKASIISGKYSGIAASFILPSHYLILANDAYDRKRWAESLEYCNQAYAAKGRLSSEGAIEALRLKGLSAIRLGDSNELATALTELGNYKSFKVGKRNALFLQGFQFRLKRRYDDAERMFLAAHKLAPRNISINRELASVYRHRREFAEAESYARIAYEFAPTNPFIIDVLLESLLGKASAGMVVDQDEITALFVELERYGDVPGSSFYQARIAQDHYRRKDYPRALEAANAAITRTPEFLPCYFLRADIRLSSGDIRGAKGDLDEVNGILDRRGGFSEEDEGKAAELEIKIYLNQKNFRHALDKLQSFQWLPSAVRRRLERDLAKAVSFEQSGTDTKVRDWAKRILARS